MTATAPNQSRIATGTHPRSPASPSPRSTTTATVLVVDDDRAILRTIEVNLRARRYEVLLAANARQALALTARRHPNIVALDLGLPDLDGLAVIDGLRTWTSVPIIVLSARRTSSTRPNMVWTLISPPGASSTTNRPNWSLRIRCPRTPPRGQQLSWLRLGEWIGSSTLDPDATAAWCWASRSRRCRPLIGRTRQPLDADAIRLASAKVGAIAGASVRRAHRGCRSRADVRRSADRARGGARSDTR